MVWTFLVILKLPISLRPTKISLNYRRPNTQRLKILTISSTFMALYASAFPVMLLVKDFAISITTRRKSTGTTGRISISELAGFMAWTFLLVVTIFSIFALLIIVTTVITNTIFPGQMKIPDEESGGKANSEKLPTHHDLAPPLNSVASFRSLGAGRRPDSGSCSDAVSRDTSTSVRDSGVQSNALTDHAGSSPTVSPVMSNSGGPIQDVSGPETTSDQRIPEIESVSQT